MHCNTKSESKVHKNITKSSIKRLEFLWLEDDVEEAAEQPHDGEGAADERADGGDELVPVLALPADHHGHRGYVVAEARLRGIFFRILKEL